MIKYDYFFLHMKVIEDVAPNAFARNRESNTYTVSEETNNEPYYQLPPEDYKVSSAPAIGSPSNRRDSYVESPYGYQVKLKILR